MQDHSRRLRWLTVGAVAAGLMVLFFTLRPLWARPRGLAPAILKPAAARSGPLPVIARSPQFAFVDQNNRPVSRDQMRGKVWIADFIFTQCGGTCPIMTDKMRVLQQRIPDLRVEFISFDVDPEHDDVPALKAYAQEHKADESRWHFLATRDMDSVLKVAEGLKVSGKPLEKDNPVLHADRFLLIDSAGSLRGSYYAGDDGALSRLVRDAIALARQHD
jgi:protein SCO1/2